MTFGSAKQCPAAAQFLEAIDSRPTRINFQAQSSATTFVDHIDPLAINDVSLSYTFEDIGPCSTAVRAFSQPPNSIAYLPHIICAPVIGDPAMREAGPSGTYSVGVPRKRHAEE